MNRRKLVFAMLFSLVGFAGISSAYVHSTIAQYRGVAPCGKLRGIPGLLQAAHFFDLGDCVTIRNPLTGQVSCDSQFTCNLRNVPSGQSGAGKCVLTQDGQSCVCIPR
jgi:hypothetical protein